LPKEIGIYCEHKFQSNLQPMRHHSSILTNGLKTSITVIIGFYRSKTPKNVHISLFKTPCELNTPTKPHPKLGPAAGSSAAPQVPLPPCKGR
jgi:hypothetical protein